MAGTGSGSRQWVIFLVVAIALIFFNKYLLIGAQAVTGVYFPDNNPLVSQPAVVKTEAPVPTEEVAVEKVITEIVTEVTKIEAPTQSIQPEEVNSATTAISSITRHGGWADEIIFTVVDQNDAVNEILGGAIDIYGYGLPSSDLPSIQSAGLNYSTQNGMFYELTFNPVGPTFPATGKFNPFSNPKIREATNWLIDREYLNQEVFNGSSLPRYLPISVNFPDYNDLSGVVKRLEAEYAYDFAKGSSIIYDEMIGMGAKMANGRWNYQGEPVTLIFLIRSDSDGTRIPIGDYVSNQFEAIGFTIDRQYKRLAETSPLWRDGNPADGLWHIYTGAWTSPGIGRESDNFQYFYDPSGRTGSPLWQAYQPSEEFHELSQKLAYNEFNNLGERRVAFTRALELAMQDSVRIWLMDGKRFAPWEQGVGVGYDLAAGVEGSYIWPQTLRLTGEEGGTIQWGSPYVLVDPWNPIAGSSWPYDATIQHATAGNGTLPDPRTGLAWPLRIESATVTAEEGLPIGKTLDWVDLEFSPVIRVPGDALVDWDADRQVFIMAAEKFPQGTTAKIKSVVVYPADLWEIVTFHDGSPMDVADFIFYMIMQFDPGKPESAIYDEAFVPNMEYFLESFKGFQIVSEDPLTIEWYSDTYQVDAELNVATLWPTYAYGEAGWHTLAIAAMAEANGELAFSYDKAGARGIEWTNLIGGSSLDILSVYLDQAENQNYIPYAPTLGKYITPGEAAARYANMRAFFNQHGHFWIGTGPYLLDGAYVNEGVADLRSYPGYADPSDRWSMFVDP